MVLVGATFSPSRQAIEGVVVAYLKAAPLRGTRSRYSQHSSSSPSIRSSTISCVRRTREDIALLCKLEAVSSDAARAAVSRSLRCSVFRTLAASSSLLVHPQNRRSYSFTIFTLNSFSIAARTECGKWPPRKAFHLRPISRLRLRALSSRSCNVSRLKRSHPHASSPALISTPEQLP